VAWQSYRELIVWQKSMDLASETYRVVRLLPKEETFVLSEQMRRSAVSIPSNIAEGHERQSPNEFRRFLSIAAGSCSELETQLLLCKRLYCLSETDLTPALTLCVEIRKMLTSMTNQLLKTEN